MRLQGNITDLAERFGIDDGQCATAVSDEDVAGLSIDPDVIRVGAELDPADWLQVFAAKDTHGPVTAIGDIERVGGRDISEALRLL
ncbi:hypothetical protein [Bosea sp. TAF32]|uniref:hypothetical protein n=1 Tax=Bosea sp. TAF32 TaxID=3237482 RepID=UPI003F8EC273